MKDCASEFIYLFIIYLFIYYSFTYLFIYYLLYIFNIYLCIYLLFIYLLFICLFIYLFVWFCSLSTVRRSVTDIAVSFILHNQRFSDVATYERGK
jgi:hypothetical protein